MFTPFPPERRTDPAGEEDEGWIEMGDAGEGLIDADSRIQERMEELERERAVGRGRSVRNPEQVRALESLRLARTDFERQLSTTTNDRRKVQLTEAIAELDRRMAEASAALA
jgi:hypothetical protein